MSLRRSGPIARHTELKRSSKPLKRTELARGNPLVRRARLTAKAKPAEQIATERAIRESVIARDGGCLMRALEPAACMGRLTFHHLEKAGQQGDYTEHNGVCLCAFHNDDVEDHPRRYRILGLVVRPGLDHAEAAERRAAAGLGPRGAAHG